MPKRFAHIDGSMEIARKRAVLLAACMAAAAGALTSARAAPPPLPVVISDNTQDAVQTQLALQQAQAQANAAESEARLQAQLDATQARFESQVAAQEQSQLAQARGGPAGTSVGLPPPVMPIGAGSLEPARRPRGAMRLARLTPELGHYFGTNRGILVVRAPAHGALNLQDGDVILAIGGRTPSSSSQAARILASYDPGQKIRLLIMREHHRINITTVMPGPSAGR
jgi:hypothetical protein